MAHKLKLYGISLTTRYICTMHKPSKEKHFIKQPWFEGGPKAMKRFIAENLLYPQEAIEQRVEGTVTVRFEINHKGEVVDAKIIGHSLGHGCDQEAMRLAKSMKFMVEKPRGLRVIYHKTMQIHFKLPQHEQPVQMQLQYNLVEGRKTEEPKPSSGSGYTISYTLG